MHTDWILTFSPIASLALNVLTYLILIHTTHKIAVSILLGIAAGFICNLTIVMGLQYYSPADQSTSILTYIALSFCFWAFLNLNITSLRIRVIRELHLMPAQKTRSDLLLQKYSIDELINRRLERLKNSKQITNNDGKWVLESQILLIIHFATSTMRKVIFP